MLRLTWITILCMLFSACAIRPIADDYEYFAIGNTEKYVVRVPVVCKDESWGRSCSSKEEFAQIVDKTSGQVLANFEYDIDYKKPNYRKPERPLWKEPAVNAGYDPRKPKPEELQRRYFIPGMGFVLDEKIFFFQSGHLWQLRLDEGKFIDLNYGSAILANMGPGGNRVILYREKIWNNKSPKHLQILDSNGNIETLLEVHPQGYFVDDLTRAARVLYMMDVNGKPFADWKKVILPQPEKIIESGVFKGKAEFNPLLPILAQSKVGGWYALNNYDFSVLNESPVTDQEQAFALGVEQMELELEKDRKFAANVWQQYHDFFKSRARFQKSWAEDQAKKRQKELRDAPNTYKNFISYNGKLWDKAQIRMLYDAAYSLGCDKYIKAYSQYGANLETDIKRAQECGMSNNKIQAIGGSYMRILSKNIENANKKEATEQAFKNAVGASTYERQQRLKNTSTSGSSYDIHDEANKSWKKHLTEMYKKGYSDKLPD